MFSKDDFQNEIKIYKRVIELNGIWSVLFTFLSIYMIIFKSTTQMAQYKWYLLNICLWSAALDIYLSLVYLPVLLYPAVGLCNLGLFSSFDSIRLQQFQFVSILDDIYISVLGFFHRFIRWDRDLNFFRLCLSVLRRVSIDWTYT